MDHTDLIARAETIPQRNNADPQQALRGGNTNCDFLIGIGDTQFHASVKSGRIISFDRGPLLMRSWRFAIRGEYEGWQKFWAPVPPPGFHDIFALAKRGAFVIEGDFRPLMRNLLFFKGLLSLPRQIEQGL